MFVVRVVLVPVNPLGKLHEGRSFRQVIGVAIVRHCRLVVLTKGVESLRACQGRVAAFEADDLPPGHEGIDAVFVHLVVGRPGEGHDEIIGDIVIVITEAGA